MRLSEWLKLAGLTQEAFGEQVGVTQGRVNQVLNGDLPSMELAIEIERATRGAVTPNDFMPLRKDAGVR